MLEAKVVETIEADIDRVWPEISNFRSIEPGAGIESVDYEGDGVGMVRRIRTPNGTIEERLESRDDARHEFSYGIINDGESPLPFTDYSAVVKLEGGKGTTTVNWVGTFESRGVEDDEAIELACSIYRNLIDQARKAVSG